ncbi:phosphotransferase [Kineococcus sp. DHX-1]|uniref:phosphotransferase n=1 Tax=Kineococcus sp. DHX-1 TaxID=3349638 RepID=UPI0036D30C23
MATDDAPWHRRRLTAEQVVRVHEWLGPVRLLRDMSWNQLDTTVLRVTDGTDEFVVKAAGKANHHLLREITAHEDAVAVLAASGHAPRLLHADRERRVLVTRYLAGELVEGTAAEHDPEVHRQAGRLLRVLHAQDGRVDEEFERSATAGSLAALDRPHRIPAVQADRVRTVLTAYRPRPVVVVPTHGDWQPRNWLLDAGTVRVIDVGRFDRRPAMSDLCRLAVQQWRTDARLEAAFLGGYRHDPRDAGVWPLLQVREAVGTAVWAHEVGDGRFERQGLRMLHEALGAFG